MKKLVFTLFCFVVLWTLSFMAALAADAGWLPYRLATGKVTLNSTTAVLVVAKDTIQRESTLENTDAAILIYIGPAGVTAATGKKLRPGIPVLLRTLGEVYAISASGTPVIDYFIEK